MSKYGEPWRAANVGENKTVVNTDRKFVAVECRPDGLDLTPEQLQAAMDYYRVVFSGRTRYEGRTPWHDEVIVAALAASERKRKELAEAVDVLCEDCWEYDDETGDYCCEDS